MIAGIAIGLVLGVLACASATARTQRGGAAFREIPSIRLVQEIRRRKKVRVRR